MKKIYDHQLSNTVLAVASGVIAHLQTALENRVRKIEYMNNHDLYDDGFCRQICILTNSCNLTIIEIANHNIRVYDAKYLKDIIEAERNCSIKPKPHAEIEYEDPTFLEQVVQAVETCNIL